MIPIVRSGLLATLFLTVACKEPAPVPLNVVGIAFGSRLSELRGSSLAPEAAPDNYMLVPFYGYLLNYPNPENWTVFVNDSAPGVLAENRVFAVALSKDLGHECKSADQQSLVSRLDTLYSRDFAERALIDSPETEEVSLILASDRKFLAIAVRCWVENVTAVFSYFDLDLFSYADSAEVIRAVNDMNRIAEGYQARTLRR